MENNNVKTSKITKKDLVKIWLRWHCSYLHAASYVRYYGIAFAWAIMPVLKKLYAGKDEEYKQACMRETSFYITEVAFGNIITGIILAMEEEKAEGADIPDEAFVSIKSALMGPIAGFGDSLFDACIRTLTISIFQPMAAEGLLIAPIAAWLILWLDRPIVGWFALQSGHKLGRTAVENLMENGLLQKILTVSGILSMFIMGSMSNSYVKLGINPDLIITGETTVQSVINTCAPGIFPLAAVLICYWLMSKKQVSINKIILGIAAFCLLGAGIGLL